MAGGFSHCSFLCIRLALERCLTGGRNYVLFCSRLDGRVTKVYEGLEQAMHVRQLRNKFNLRKSQLRKLLDKAAGLTTVVVSDLYSVLFDLSTQNLL